MTGFDHDDDDDTCGCVGYGGKQCDYHAAQAKQHAEDERRYYRSHGIDPDGDVPDGLVGLILGIETSQSLSDSQKMAIRRVLFPYNPSTNGKP